MNVLIIPDDQELDRYIVKPVVEAVFGDLGLTARVSVLPEPRLRGTSEALDRDLIAQIVAENPMEDLFLLIIDRDCDRENNERLARQRQDEHTGKLIACIAVQEVEVWLLALYKDKLDVDRFAKVREHCDPKERWAIPLLDRLGYQGPGRGRKRAMQALARKWRSLRGTCTELRELQNAIAVWHKRSRASTSP